MRISTSDGGFALLMVVLLLALLSGAVLQSLVSARLTLRAGSERQVRLSLHAALLDAAWAALKSGMKAGTAAGDYQVFETAQPDGIRTRVTLKGISREALPVPLQRRDLPVFGQVFTMTAKAETPARSGTAQALGCRLPTGDIRLLAWVERP